MSAVLNAALRLCAAAIAVSTAAPAAASPADVFGLGSRLPAMANTGIALADDGSAGWYEPAGIALSDSGQVQVGLTHSGFNLDVGGHAADPLDPVALYVALSGPIPFKAWLERRLYVGVAIYMPLTRILRVSTRATTDFINPMYDTRADRLAVLPTLAVRVFDWLRLGVSANYFANLTGQVQSFEGELREVETYVAEDLPSVASFNAGLHIKPLQELDVALVFRDEFAVRFFTTADVNLAGAIILLSLEGLSNYSPRQVSLGTSYSPLEELTLSLDITWEQWSNFSGGFTTVKTDIPILLGRLAPPLPLVPFDDVFTAGLGVEYRLPLAEGHLLPLRAGYHYKPSPLPLQDAITNMGGGDRHIAGLGAGWEGPGFGDSRAFIAFHGQLQVLAPRTDVKDAARLPDALPDKGTDPATLGKQIDNPGYPQIESGGVAWQWGFTLGSRL